MLCANIEEDCTKFYAFGKVMECSAGWHRADLAARFYTEAMNEIQIDGHNVFNAELFVLNECTDNTSGVDRPARSRYAFS